MKKIDWKPYEPTLHRLMGFGSQLFNLRLLLTRREFKQLPPDKKSLPVLFIVDPSILNSSYIRDDYHSDVDAAEYWSRERVMDTLNDSREYDQGGTVGWFVVAAGFTKLGSWLF